MNYVVGSIACGIACCVALLYAIALSGGVLRLLKFSSANEALAKLVCESSLVPSVNLQPIY